MAAPRLQIRSVRRDGDVLWLKAARRWVMVGTLALPLSLLGLLAMWSGGAPLVWLLLPGAFVLLGAACFLVGPIHRVDTAAGTVRLASGRTLDKSDLAFLEVKVLWGTGVSGAYSRARLIATFRSLPQPVVLADARKEEPLEDLGRELARSLGAKWRNPSAKEKAHRRARKNVLPQSW